MPSPFPGIDPYLEASGRWQGFHNTFITYCNGYLNARLPPGYASVVQERIELVDLRGLPLARHVLPDVAVTGDRSPASRASAATRGAATMEPALLTLPSVLEVPEAYLEIIALPDRELVTSIELLSPMNKTGAGHARYLAKRNAAILRRINLVELDLLVAGERLEMVEPLPRGDYFALVSRGDQMPECEVYAWSVRQPLPVIPIPLRAPDADVMFDLGQVFATTYDEGRYRQTLPYHGPPPPLSDSEDQAWAMEATRAAVA